MKRAQVDARDVIEELKRQIAEQAQEIAMLRVQLNNGTDGENIHDGESGAAT